MQMAPATPPAGPAVLRCVAARIRGWLTSYQNAKGAAELRQQIWRGRRQNQSWRRPKTPAQSARMAAAGTAAARAVWAAAAFPYILSYQTPTLAHAKQRQGRHAYRCYQCYQCSRSYQNVNSVTGARIFVMIDKFMGLRRFRRPPKRTFTSILLLFQLLSLSWSKPVKTAKN